MESTIQRWVQPTFEINPQTYALTFTNGQGEEINQSTFFQIKDNILKSIMAPFEGIIAMIQPVLHMRRRTERIISNYRIKKLPVV